MNPGKLTALHRILIVCVGLMASAGLKRAEPVEGVADWANLKQLSAGEEMQVVLNDAKSYRGRFESVSQDALTVRREAGEQSFDRKSVLRVSAKAGSHRLRNAMLGGLIAVAAGPGIGAAAGTSSKNGFTTINESVGVGAALPATGWRTVYRAGSLNH
jgi:hypothetical protein